MITIKKAHWIFKWMPKRIGAFATPWAIYARDADPMPALIAHEKVHVKQMQNLGTPIFLVRYVAEFVMNYIRMWSVRDAYRAISFEKEARETKDINATT